MKITAVFARLFNPAELDLPEERLKSQTLSLIILIYIAFLVVLIVVLFIKLGRPELSLIAPLFLWLIGSLFSLRLARSKSYKIAASLFGTLCTLSVLTSTLTTESPLYVISIIPFIIIALIVSFLYGAFKHSVVLAGFILLSTALIPYINDRISPILVWVPLLFLGLTSTLLIVAHHQRQVEKGILAKERERSLHDMRLRSMGELTANIAHQMGTPLTVIEMAIENARENFKTGKTAQALAQLQVSEDTISRSKQFIDALKNLYQPQKITQGSCTLAWIISQIRFFYGPKLAEQKVVLTGGHDLLHEIIPIPGEDLLQCILNLVDNSIHALKGQANASIKLTLKRSEESLCLIYSDNGPGISKSLIHQIFDPFFTTKDQGEGTGLGLPIVQAILRRHHAEISIVSPNVSGACFKIDFKLPEPK